MYIVMYICILSGGLNTTAKILEGTLEEFVHIRMKEIGSEFRVELMAVNSAWDHVHSLFRWNTAYAIGDVVKQLKGNTSTEWNEMARGSGLEIPLLSWQRGYGVLSIDRSRIDQIIAYIANQKNQHRNKTLSPGLEKTDPHTARRTRRAPRP